MKKFFLIALAALAIASCTGGNKAKIVLNLQDGAGKQVLVSILRTDEVSVVDTMKLNGNGVGKCIVPVTEKNPQFYYLSYGRNLIAQLILEGGDKVKVSVDTLGRNLEVSGSENTSSLIEVNAMVDQANRTLDSLAAILQTAREQENNEQVADVAHKMGQAFITYKRQAVKYIINNPYSFANVNLLYQRVAPTLPLFGDANDVAYYQRVYDSLSVEYPNSKYVARLVDDIKGFSDVLAFNSHVGAAGEISYPELEMPDVNGEMVKLSSLAGKPFILYFWTAQDAGHKMLNHDLMEIYSQYHSKGLEIYQVCVDADKTNWATTVKAQKLPWINVCDGLAEYSQAPALYNVTSIPTIYIFDAQGNIVDKQIFEKSRILSVLSRIL